MNIWTICLIVLIVMLFSGGFGFIGPSYGYGGGGLLLVLLLVLLFVPWRGR